MLKNMRILGIDPGTAITGFGVIDKNGQKLSLVTAGVVRTPAKQALPKRLDTIFKEIIILIEECKPQQVAVEQLYFAKNVTTAMSVSHARGVILLAAHRADLVIGEYTPQQVKQAVTGYGGAKKAQIQAMVKNILGLEKAPKPDDAADALAVAICHSGVIST